MSKDKVDIPKSLRGRVRDVAAKHALGSAEEAAMHFVTRGLDHYRAPTGRAQRGSMAWSRTKATRRARELVEHLLLRGLRAYEAAKAGSPEALAARLRGLGYID